MSSILKNAAVAAVTRRQLSTFYDRDNRPNPMLQALDHELKQFLGFLKKRSSSGYTKSAEEPSGRPANTLFNLWNKYQPCLPSLYYEKKLLEVGDILLSMKENKIALSQCFERFLQSYGDINMKETTDIDLFRATFYKNGLRDENVGLITRAILGKSICMYHIVKLDDVKLQNIQSVEKCLQILSLLRLVMQVVIARESLCWTIYNGTIHIYSIARHLMTLGHSSKVLEYLLWAAMCMETLVPLLTTKYLSWQVTLYTAVCQCYYDCKAGEHAESFARRGLTKIHELSNLEQLSSSKNSAIYEDSFRSATVRMAVMVFKRTVFETRRKPKGLLRPKTRANLKEVLNMPWPRTPTESMLADMFDGGSAQFLAILEALKDSNRRILQTSPPSTDNEPEILDVFCELMMAAQEILAGGGGNQAPGLKSQMSTGTSSLTSVIVSGSLIQLATKGEDKVPLESVVQLLKLAHAYEHWDIFNTLITPVISLIQESHDIRFHWDEKVFDLLLAMEKVNTHYRQKKQISEEEVEKMIPDDKSKKVKSKAKSIDKPIEKHHLPVVVQKKNQGDDLLHVAVVLMSIVSGEFKQEEIEIDLVVDATVFLWNKCKPVFQKCQAGVVDIPKFLQKMDNPSKWTYMLSTVHRAVSWCGISCFDPILAAEVGLRLALLHECIAKLSCTDGTKSAQRESRTTLVESDTASVGNNPNVGLSNQLPHGVPTTANENILLAKDILELTLANINCARHTVAMNDGKNIADVSYMKTFCKEDISKSSTDGKTNKEEQISRTMKKTSTKTKNIIKDLHLELIFTYHRVCLKLCHQNPEICDKSDKKKTKPIKIDMKDNAVPNTPDSFKEDFNVLCNRCNKNYLSKALLLAQRAISLVGTQQESAPEQKKLLEQAFSLIQKVQLEERRVVSENANVRANNVQSKVPPPPILLCLTDTYMVLKPAPFEPESGQKVAWYCIYARCAAGPNVKVRLSDNSFPGTGEEVPSFNCEMKVTNLEPNERYVFAVAAFSANGNLIGDHIGESTKPFLAVNPLPVLTAWAFVSQIAYQVGYYKIASQACSVLWNHFVEKPSTTSAGTYITGVKKDFQISLLRLKQKTLDNASPILLRLFLNSLLYSADIAIKEGQLFCDIVYDKGIFYDCQIQRLQQCGRLVIALELAGWLNEGNLALQAVVQIYGLLVPILYHKIPSISAIQILQKCHSVLLEIPPEIIKKRQSSISESLNHMIACIIYYLIKSLRGWGQKEIANSIIESGRLLLTSDGETKEKDVKVEVIDEIAEKGVAGKAKKSIVVSKKLSTKSVAEGAINEELKALDAFMTCETTTQEQELNANDDPSMLYAHISCMPSSSVFKEVDKFKSKPHYLEVLVYAAQKGLMENLQDQVIQLWADGIKWLTLRNENIIGPNPYINKQPGAVVVIGDDPRKFAAAMVEYKKDKGPKTEKGSGKNVEKKRQKYKPLRVRPSMSEASQKKQEEIELKALDILSTHFVERYKATQRNKTFRKINFVEMPWRSQMNVIQGLCHFNILLQKLDKGKRMLQIFVNKTNILDHEWLTLETAGVMITEWHGGHSRPQAKLGTALSWGSDHIQLDVNQRAADEQPIHLIELAAAVVTEPVVPEIDVVPLTNRSDKSDKNQVQIETKAQETTLTPEITMESLKKTFNYFKKAIVLAHRGKHWTLLQNVGHVLWNCAHTAILHICATSHFGGGSALMTLDELWILLWCPFYVATDCLLDMLFLSHDCLEKRAKPKNKLFKDNFESWFGKIQDEQGGASLKFDTLLDDASFANIRWIRRLTLRTIELLFSQQKYEKLVDIALRFNALTNNHYAEQVIPLLLHAQMILTKRITDAGGPSPPQPHFKLLQVQLGHVIQAKDYIKAQLQVQMDKMQKIHIEPGVHIDPIGHRAYTNLDSFRLSSVPLDTAVSHQELQETIDQAHYTARALQHSRKLLCLYLAGQQYHSLYHRDASHVDFQINLKSSHTTMPSNSSTSEFNIADEVQFSPLPRSQLGVVISSYENSIEILQAKNLKGTSAQAMHELGNICFHAKNTRAAFHWWCQSLDIVLKTKDAIHTWRSGLQNAEDISASFLNRCGIWGCLLAGVLSSNIAQYTVTNDDRLRIECCLLSGYLFKALFRSSLPHPTSDRDYALYDIGEGCAVTSLTPGLDFLSDKFRCDGRQMIAALKWIIEELSRAQFNLFVCLYNFK